MKPEEIRQMEHDQVKLSYNQIDDCIFAGNNLCCQTHFHDELLSKGITADISLEIENLDSPFGVNYFFWFPWKEDTAPSSQLIDLSHRVLDDLIKHKIKTYIHCKNGHGRTSTFLASYFIHRYGVTTDQALEMLLKKRPSAHWNFVQEAFLRDFERRAKP